MSEHAEDATWWTPSGWITAPPPYAYRRALGDDGRFRFEAEGYDEAVTLAGNESPLSPSPRLRVRNHRDGHTLVQIDVIDFTESLFISRKHVLAFYFDKIPGLMSPIAQQAATAPPADPNQSDHSLAFADRSPGHGSARWRPTAPGLHPLPLSKREIQ